MGETRNVFRRFVGTFVRKINLKSFRWRWKNSFKIDLGEVGCEDGRRVELAQDHVQWRLWS
jgi:hypothetical protein